LYHLSLFKLAIRIFNKETFYTFFPKYSDSDHISKLSASAFVVLVKATTTLSRTFLGKMAVISAKTYRSDAVMQQR